MKKILGLLVIALVVSISASAVFAKNLPALTAANKLEYQNILKGYIQPIGYGYGIGFNSDNYITAKWYIASTKSLNTSQLREMIKNSNATDWSQAKSIVQNALQTASSVNKGRIQIGKDIYILTNIVSSDSSLTANIRALPIYANCNAQNITAEQCESMATQVGSLSLAKKTNATDAASNEQVWAGTLNFNSVAYTFVTFSYPKVASYPVGPRGYPAGARGYGSVGR